MDRATTGHLNDIEQYGEEVLNASWLPQEMLRPNVIHRSHTSATTGNNEACIIDPVSFMHQLYLAQE